MRPNRPHNNGTDSSTLVGVQDDGQEPRALRGIEAPVLFEQSDSRRVVAQGMLKLKGGHGAIEADATITRTSPWARSAPPPASWVPSAAFSSDSPTPRPITPAGRNPSPSAQHLPLPETLPPRSPRPPTSPRSPFCQFHRRPALTNLKGRVLANASRFPFE